MDRVILVLRNNAGFEQFLIAFSLGAGIGELRLVARQVRFILM